MTAVLDAALPVFALILAGYLCARWRVLGDTAADVLNRFVLYLALPALLFQAMARTSWSTFANVGFLVSFGGGLLVTFVLGLWLARRSGEGDGVDAVISGMGAAYGNAGYMGIPLCLVAFGPESLPPAIASTLMTACALFALSVVMVETRLQQGRSPLHALAKVGRALVRNPLVAAPVAGLAWSLTGVALPASIDRFAGLLGAAASPCALVTIGLFLAIPQVARDPVQVSRLVVLKLLVQPAVTAVLAFWVFDLPPVWAYSAVLLAALPIGTGPFMLAQLYGRGAGVMSRAILVSTVASLPTVSLLLAWFQVG
jgi:malonate transporter